MVAQVKSNIPLTTRLLATSLPSVVVAPILMVVEVTTAELPKTLSETQVPSIQNWSREHNACAPYVHGLLLLSKQKNKINYHHATCYIDQKRNEFYTLPANTRYLVPNTYSYIISYKIKDFCTSFNLYLIRVSDFNCSFCVGWDVDFSFCAGGIGAGLDGGLEDKASAESPANGSAMRWNNSREEQYRVIKFFMTLILFLNHTDP